eukprot:4870013-Amphidinium_carterae.1
MDQYSETQLAEDKDTEAAFTPSLIGRTQSSLPALQEELEGMVPGGNRSQLHGMRSVAQLIVGQGRRSTSLPSAELNAFTHTDGGIVCVSGIDNAVIKVELCSEDSAVAKAELWSEHPPTSRYLSNTTHGRGK